MKIVFFAFLMKIWKFQVVTQITKPLPPTEILPPKPIIIAPIIVWKHKHKTRVGVTYAGKGYHTGFSGYPFLNFYDTDRLNTEVLN